MDSVPIATSFFPKRAKQEERYSIPKIVHTAQARCTHTAFYRVPTARWALCQGPLWVQTDRLLFSDDVMTASLPAEQYKGFCTHEVNLGVKAHISKEDLNFIGILDSYFGRKTFPDNEVHQMAPLSWVTAVLKSNKSQ